MATQTEQGRVPRLTPDDIEREQQIAAEELATYNTIDPNWAAREIAFLRLQLRITRASLDEAWRMHTDALDRIVTTLKGGTRE